jgi:hypothetical protein
LIRLKIITIMLLVISYLGFYSSSASAGIDESILINSVNTQRVVRGLPELTINDELTDLSLQWSKVLATNGALSHSDLVTGVTQTWKKLGENVGSGSSASMVAAALVTSPTHFANMIDPDFTMIGVGVTVSDNVIYVVQKFIQPSEQIVVKPVPTTTTTAVPTTSTTLPVTIPPSTTTIILPPSPTTTNPVTTTLPPTIVPKEEPGKTVGEVQYHRKTKLQVFFSKLISLVRRIILKN